MTTGIQCEVANRFVHPVYMCMAIVCITQRQSGIVVAVAAQLVSRWLICFVSNSPCCSACSSYQDESKICHTENRLLLPGLSPIGDLR